MNADLLLAPAPCREETQEDMVLHLPIHDVSATPTPSFWGYPQGGEHILPAGCVPLTESPTQSQYDAVLETQTHLRDLKMLQLLEPADIGILISQLRQLCMVTKHGSLVFSLIEALIHETVVVYKGLGTGFVIPKNTAELWGVSDYRISDGVIDIFISRNCPSDASTVLHTWLARHSVSREGRYEEELLLEHVVMGPLANTFSLPTSMRAAISKSTPAELLALLHRVHVSKLTGSFRAPIEKFCRAVLLDDTTVAEWNDAASNGFLSGAVTIQDLLSRRIIKHLNAGSTQLPSLDNLVELYARLETSINNALFLGDRETLNKLVSLLCRAYNTASNTPVDINTDLLILMFFCVIRKAALEDVYLEATDHCPTFSQADQAAVFSELWVLGSQCEQYFCMKPRALGKMIYDRHRGFLKEFPPQVRKERDEDGSLKGGLMSVYAKVEPVKEKEGMERNYPAIQGSWKVVKRTWQQIHQGFISFGALSIFCLPAIVDLVLLTFVGRGLFMTAFMGDQYLIASCYGLLVSLLISAGVTGWVGSVGNYYLCHYAYHNMVYFHVQRLSGGFMLSLFVGVIGAVVFGIKISLTSALTFFAYLILLSTYLNVLGKLEFMSLSLCHTN